MNINIHIHHHAPHNGTEEISQKLDYIIMNIQELNEKVEVQSVLILHLQEVIDTEQAEILASTEALRVQNDEQKALILELQALLEGGGGTDEEMQAISDKLDANAAAIEAAIADIEATVTPEPPVEPPVITPPVEEPPVVVILPTEPIEPLPPVETTVTIENGERITRNVAGEIISREPTTDTFTVTIENGFRITRNAAGVVTRRERITN